jgi:hypothetical protein
MLVYIVRTGAGVSIWAQYPSGLPESEPKQNGLPLPPGTMCDDPVITALQAAAEPYPLPMTLT